MCSEKLSGIHFTISLGVSHGKIINPALRTLSELIRLADLNLNQAKAAGKNCWVI